MDFSKESIVTKSVPLGELNDPVANHADQRVDTEPRQDILAGFLYSLCPYRDLRQAFLSSRALQSYLL